MADIAMPIAGQKHSQAHAGGRVGESTSGLFVPDSYLHSVRWDAMAWTICDEVRR